MEMFNVLLNLMARLIVLFIAFPIHESAHALMAQKLGDPTARNMGRIDLNPFSHMNPLPCFGMILLASLMDYSTGSSTYGNLILLLTSVFFFRAVPINPMYFKKRKAGIALTAFAGPLSNVVLGAIFLILYKLVFYFLPTSGMFDIVLMVFMVVLQINLQLAAFNLLPLPPLDGSKILAFFLPDRFSDWMQRYQTYVLVGVIFLLYFTSVLDYFISFVYGILFQFVNFITGFVDLLYTVI